MARWHITVFPGNHSIVHCVAPGFLVIIRVPVWPRHNHPYTLDQNTLYSSYLYIQLQRNTIACQYTITSNIIIQSECRSSKFILSTTRWFSNISLLLSTVWICTFAYGPYSQLHEIHPRVGVEQKKKELFISYRWFWPWNEYTSQLQHYNRLPNTV